MFDGDLIKMIGVLKLFMPLAGMLKNIAVPVQSYTDKEPKEIEINARKEYVVTVKLSYNKKEDAQQLIDTYNSIDEVLRKLK